MPVKTDVNIPFKLHNEGLTANDHVLVLSQRTWDPIITNDIFEVDCRWQSLRSHAASGSKIVQAMNMVNRPAADWVSKAKPWYLRSPSIKGDENKLYLPLGDYFDPEIPILYTIRHLVCKTDLPAGIRTPATRAMRALPEASDIPVAVAADVPLTATEVAKTKLRTAAQALLYENRKAVHYGDGRPVPPSAWKVVLPLFKTEAGKKVALMSDLLDQTRAHKLMNQRPVSDFMADKLVRSMKDTPELVELPEKIGVLLSPTPYQRLNDLDYKGNIFEGLLENEIYYPDEPTAAILAGERHLIIIAGNHTTMAQLKLVKEAILQDR